MDRSQDLQAIQTAMTRIGRVQNSFRARRRIEERAGVALAPTTIATLAAIRALQPARHGAVAQRAGLQPSRVSKEVRALVDAGLVRERPDPLDGRAILLATTARGAAAHDRYVVAGRQVLAEVLDDWSERDVGELARLLERLADDFARAAPSDARPAARVS